MSSRGPTETLGEHLEELAARFPYDRSLPQDPLSAVRPFAQDRSAAEIVGVFASTVAVGNVKSIQRSLAALLARTGGDPRGFVENFPSHRWRMELHPWKHRWIRSDHMGFLCVRLQEIYRRYPGGLEEVFLTGAERGTGDDEAEARFSNGLNALSEALRWGSIDRAPTVFEPPPGYLRLFPTPLGPGRPACKRETLFLRWMARKGYPDLGLWKGVPSSWLHVPLDTHVYWIARHLGLTHRSSRNWPTVVEITRGLRRYDAKDPVRFDFVLAHTGISGDCPKRRDAKVCAPCVLRADCDLWRRSRVTFLPFPAPAQGTSQVVTPARLSRGRA